MKKRQQRGTRDEQPKGRERRGEASRRTGVEESLDAALEEMANVRIAGLGPVGEERLAFELVIDQVDEAHWSPVNEKRLPTGSEQPMNFLTPPSASRSTPS